jgi:hypothetical protein
LPSRTPAAAVSAVKEALQRAVSCVSSAVLVVSPGGYRAGDEIHYLTFAQDIVHLSSDVVGGVRMRYSYRIRPDPVDSRARLVICAGYFYALHDRDEREIVAYHWHPEGRSPIVTPHLHLGPGAAVGRLELTRGHLPTGRIGVSTLLQFAIRDLGVRPLRDDWVAILDAPEEPA